MATRRERVSRRCSRLLYVFADTVCTDNARARKGLSVRVEWRHRRVARGATFIKSTVARGGSVVCAAKQQRYKRDDKRSQRSLGSVRLHSFLTSAVKRAADRTILMSTKSHRIAQRHSLERRASAWPCFSQFAPSNPSNVSDVMVLLSRHRTLTEKPSGLLRRSVSAAFAPFLSLLRTFLARRTTSRHTFCRTCAAPRRC